MSYQHDNENEMDFGSGENNENEVIGWAEKPEITEDYVIQRANEDTEKSTKDKMKEFERKVVASVLHDVSTRAFALETELDTRFFSNPVYQKIMRIFNSLANGQVDPTISLIIEQINPNQQEKVALERLIEDLKNHTEELDTVKVYIQMLKKQYKIRRYLEFADELKDLVEKEKISPLSSEFDDMDKEIDYKFSSLLEEYSKSDRVDMDVAQGFEHVMESMNESIHSESREIVPTGYAEIDKIYNGGHLKGTYSIIAARPGMGKSVYMLNEALEGARKGTRSIFVSIEMNQVQCFQRIVAKLAGIDSGKLQNPKQMMAEDWKKLKQAASEVVDLFNNKFWIIEVTELNNARLRRIIQEYKKKANIDEVYVDYVQIMSTDKGGKPELESDYANISEGIRKTAKAENVAIIVGSQLSRDVEKREEKKPKLSDLRNSGSFEQDAARVVGLYRDEYYNPDTEDANILEYIILKNRFGASNTSVKLRYDIEKQSIFSQAA